MRVAEEKLVIFDYSGTLSLEAPRFARSENLLEAFSASGLAALGVATPEVFWGRIVGPTWTEGSTTTIGYKRILAERIESLGHATRATIAEMAEAASRFVDLYLAHSPIDPLWRPLLERLAGNPAAAVLIATDHYAEATEAIIHCLRSWNIPAQKAQQGADPFPPFPFLIANSADIGFWKEDRRFWEVLKLQLRPETIRSLLFIDDFGFNEEAGDCYGRRVRVAARQAKTLAILREAFHAEMEVITFFLDAEARDRQEALTGQIAETVRRIDLFLESTPCFP
jgi:hypothetical protein